MSSARRAVVVMAKAPRPGSVKTRLAPLLGHDGCAALQAALLRHAVTGAMACAPDGTFVAVHPPDAVIDVGGDVPGEARCFAQAGLHLGERMAEATARVLATGNRPVVVIGTDVPLLRPHHLEQAFTWLESGCDVVFGPALDGGYTLVGMARDRREVFGIDPACWGGPDVLATSLSIARGAGLRVGLLGTLRDLDTPEDAAVLLRSPELPADVRAALTRVGVPPVVATR